MNKGTEQNFSKDTQMANKHLKTGSTSVLVRELQIKSVVKCHFRPLSGYD